MIPTIVITPPPDSDAGNATETPTSEPFDRDAAECLTRLHPLHAVIYDIGLRATLSRYPTVAPSWVLMPDLSETRAYGGHAPKILIRVGHCNLSVPNTPNAYTKRQAVAYAQRPPAV